MIGEGASIWYGAVLRADNEPITIGARSNVQDNCAFHVDKDRPVFLGEGVSVGHGAVMHGATIGDHVLVGMGAIIMNGAVIGGESHDRCRRAGRRGHGGPAPLTRRRCAWQGAARAERGRGRDLHHNARIYEEHRDLHRGGQTV